jgi:hypothetical protein
MRGLGTQKLSAGLVSTVKTQYFLFAGGVRKHNEKGRWLRRPNNCCTKVAIELAHTAEIDGNSNKTVTVKVNIQKN